MPQHEFRIRHAAQSSHGTQQLRMNTEGNASNNEVVHRQNPHGIVSAKVELMPQEHLGSGMASGQGALQSMSLVEQKTFVSTDLSSHGPVQQNLQEAGLIRYHSAPGSMLASISRDRTDEILLTQDMDELAHIIQSSCPCASAVLDSSKRIQPTNESCSLNNRQMEWKMDIHPSNEASSVAEQEMNVDRSLNMCTFPTSANLNAARPHFNPPVSTEMSSSYAKDVVSPFQPVMCRSTCDVGSTQVPSSVNGVGLLRHSSSPASFSSLLSDGIISSTSGNSSEEGNYERKGTHSSFRICASMDPDNNMLGSPHACTVAGKRARELDFGGSSPRHGDLMDHGASIVHHFGFLTSNNGTFCHARAKRGCATHPRSIAERVRRSKITERMKRLQELVPHLDKQTNTSEMLDEVVEYVKALQQKVQELTEHESSCTCDHKTLTESMQR